jgi:hypothetical protein
LATYQRTRSSTSGERMSVMAKPRRRRCHRSSVGCVRSSFATGCAPSSARFSPSNGGRRVASSSRTLGSGGGVGVGFFATGSGAGSAGGTVSGMARRAAGASGTASGVSAQADCSSAAAAAKILPEIPLSPCMQAG